MGFIIAAAVAAAVIAFCFLCYKSPATQAIVVTGFGLSRPKVVCGRASLCCPLCSAQTA